MAEEEVAAMVKRSLAQMAQEVKQRERKQRRRQHTYTNLADFTGKGVAHDDK